MEDNVGFEEPSVDTFADVALIVLRGALCDREFRQSIQLKYEKDTSVNIYPYKDIFIYKL